MNDGLIDAVGRGRTICASVNVYFFLVTTKILNYIMHLIFGFETKSVGEENISKQLFPLKIFLRSYFGDWQKI